MKNMKSLLLQTLTVLVAACHGFGQQLVANTYDAAVETHKDTVNRTNDVAITARHLLWKKGSTDTGLALNGLSEVPWGTVNNIETGTGLNQTVLLLGKDATKKMVAAGAIAAGVKVFAAASGKVSAQPSGASTYVCVGVALTATANADEILEVMDCVPYPVVTLA